MRIYRDVVVEGGSEWVSDVVNVLPYVVKQIIIVVDYGMEINIEVSLDGVNFYILESIPSDQVKTKPYVNSFLFDDPFPYMRIKVKNSDTSSHRVELCVIRASRE